MTKLNFVQRANKDYPKQGIKKGDSYYWWQHFRQPRQMSKEKPKGSQIASSEYARSVLALIENLESYSDLAWGEEERDELVSELEQIRDEEQEKFDNMPEGFQMGDTGQQIEERVYELDSWIDDLNSIDFEDKNDSPLEQALASAIGV